MNTKFSIQNSIHLEKTLADCLTCLAYVAIRVNSQIDSNISELINRKPGDTCLVPDFESIKNYADGLIHQAQKIHKRVSQYESNWRTEFNFCASFNPLPSEIARDGHSRCCRDCVPTTPTSPNWENSEASFLTRD